MYTSSVLSPGSIIENRYRIVRELGQGGFGRTYLAENTNRFHESCVLKEFVPQVQNSQEWHKAKELFEREAGMLYQLNHSQIPCFREMLKVNIGKQESLFLVQDYIEGQTYSQLLKAGKRFSEADLIQLLFKLLPVLQYIHRQNVIHRDISPDNIILRSKDKLPILIDFGSVKQVAMSAGSANHQQPLGTIIGKDGYAPEEQMQFGEISPSSDLYALGATILVLLTNREPEDLYESANATWNLQTINVSAGFREFLTKMLAYRPRDRYSSAEEALEALRNNNTPGSLPQQKTYQAPTTAAPTTISPAASSNHNHGVFNQAVSKLRTVVVAPARPLKTMLTSLTSFRQINQGGSNALNKNLGSEGVLKIISFGIGIALLISLGTWGIKQVFALIPWPFASTTQEESLPTQPDENVSSTEQERQAKIISRLNKIDIEEKAFYDQVNETFYSQNPQLKDYTLTGEEKDRQYREQWYQIAEDLLQELENG
ncbi:MAG: protein kinase, partial [Spirulinaceae cyanobacterium]